MPDLWANPTKLACRCLVLGSATIASTRRRAVQIRLSTARPKSGPKLVKPGKALVLAVSKSSARVASSSGNSACPSAQSTAREGDLVFLCPVHQPVPPLGSSNTTCSRLGSKPRVLEASPRERACSKSGLRAPKPALAPPCLLEPPSTETQHFSIRQSSIYVGL